ncbi:hypothetical protein [Bifidobacterium aquikefiricola]
MLSKDEKERLRGLSKEHAENTGLHMLAAYALEEEDPQAALEHAKWIARQASRVDVARETLAFIAYRQGEYKLAMREFRTAFRMNGYLDYLPFIADCERGVGNPKKALEVASSDEGKQLRGEAKAEMFLVYAGALADLGLLDKAVETVTTLANAKGLSGEYRMRAVQAQQNFLEQAGRADEAAELDTLLDKLETKYADADDDESAEDIVVDHDLEEISDRDLETLGIEADDERYSERPGRYERHETRRDHSFRNDAQDQKASQEAELPDEAEVTDVTDVTDAPDTDTKESAYVTDSADVAETTETTTTDVTDAADTDDATATANTVDAPQHDSANAASESEDKESSNN